MGVDNIGLDGLNQTTYQAEWMRQKARIGIPVGHLPVHRWYLRHETPWAIGVKTPPRDGLEIIRAVNPSVQFYRFLYHTAGEEFVWGDRRRLSDDQISAIVTHVEVHVMVLYDRGTPAGFFELDMRHKDVTEIKYFALLPGFIGSGLGSYMLHQAIWIASQRNFPVILDTCTLDHPFALENYRSRGFVVYREQDEEYLDPRLDGTIPITAGKHVPLAQ